ncbi:DUF5412 family protein [Paenibacillus paridis]|uniref:DUF5412 family protein n=1 Tax=Paenibacillus paridis TaxID=2583376 RepID=UPI0011239B93|nr:DUF5412 family protein [Paenibacillus paridis]
MRLNTKKLWIVISSLVICIFSFLVYQNLSYEFEFEKGVKDNELVSPSGDYTAQVYYHYYGGAAGGVNVSVNIISHKENNAKSTVYYSDAKSDFHIDWTENNKLYVKNANGAEDRSIILAIGKDIYDESGNACFKYKISKKYSCYSKKSKHIPMVN